MFKGLSLRGDPRLVPKHHLRGPNVIKVFDCAVLGNVLAALGPWPSAQLTFGACVARLYTRP